MNKLGFLTAVLLGMATLASAQAMSGSMGGTSDKGAGSMMSSSDSMMANDMSYDALKKAGKLADVAMGMRLRTAMSTGMKAVFKDLGAAEALAAKSPTVLFFAADWCPSCQADLKDINSNGSRLGKINVVVVDYDKSADLKARYGITVQDTFVQIGAMGEKMGIWNGGGVQGIVANVKEAM
jgi:thiol-disulfide isomerase/thioredoxin